MISRKRFSYLWIILIGLVSLGGLFLLVRGLQPDPPPARKFQKLLRSRRAAGRPNIILVTLDTTRADHLSIYGNKSVETPHLEQLAREGILFEQCVSSSPFTLPSHCSILTGLLPTYHGVRINGNTALADSHLTLAEKLGESGYRCGAFIGAFVLDGRWGLKQGFHHYDDQFDLEKYKRLDLGLVQRRGDVVVDAALHWMNEQKEVPFFAWIHLYDPHVPYEPPEPYLSRYSGRGMPGLYDGEIAFMDEQIGRIDRWMKELPHSADTVMALIGDHGEGLGEHGETTHGYYIYDYAVRVPLLLVTSIPRLQGIRVPAQVRTIDLYPTLLEAVGISLPEPLHGQSLLPLVFAPKQGQSRPAYSESLAPNIQFGWSPLYSLRKYPLKFIEAPRPELYELENDPGELSDIKLKRSVEMKRMQQELKRLIEETGRGAPPTQVADLDRETMNRLASLGYLGSTTTTASIESGQKLADPKDKYAVYEAVTQASEWIAQEKITEAVAVLENALREDPAITQARLFLATCYQKQKRLAEAKAQLDVILQSDSNHIQSLITLANILLQERKEDDVLAICRKAIAVDPKSSQAYMLIGDIYLGRKDYAEALPNVQKAVDIQPKMTQSRQNLAICLIGLHRYSEAETILRSIVAEHDRFPLARFHLALLQEEQGRFEEAKKLYREEIDHYPKAYNARFNYGKLLLREGDLPGYLSQMEEVISLAPQQPQGYLFLARGLVNDGIQLDRAEELVRKGLSLAGGDELLTLGYLLLADIYSRRGDADSAADALAKARRFQKQKGVTS